MLTAIETCGLVQVSLNAWRRQILVRLGNWFSFGLSEVRSSRPDEAFTEQEKEDGCLPAGVMRTCVAGLDRLFTPQGRRVGERAWDFLPPSEQQRLTDDQHMPCRAFNIVVHEVRNRYCASDWHHGGKVVAFYSLLRPE